MKASVSKKKNYTTQKQYNQRIPKFAVLFISQISLCCMALSAQAQTAPAPSSAPVELNLLNSNRALAARNVFTADTIAERGLTVPSLWWAREQFAGKLVDNWLAYPNERRIDLVVNRQLWTILDYIERYTFINQFGTVARDFGYSVRVFNPQRVLLGAYTCNFNSPTPDCRVELESGGQEGFRARSPRTIPGF